MTMISKLSLCALTLGYGNHMFETDKKEIQEEVVGMRDGVDAVPVSLHRSYNDMSGAVGAVLEKINAAEAALNDARAELAWLEAPCDASDCSNQGQVEGGVRPHCQCACPPGWRGPKCNSKSRYVRLTEENATCAGEGFRDIDTYDECDAAFDANIHVDKRSDQFANISVVDYSFRPKGCFSACFSDYAGHFCRYYNTHSTGSGEGTKEGEAGQASGLRYMLCANDKYARVMTDGATCESEGYAPIETLDECEVAFDAETYLHKTSSRNHSVKEVHYSFRPKGCYSSCFSENSGYFCRYFNTHDTGNVTEQYGSAGTGHEDSQFVLCKTA